MDPSSSNASPTVFISYTHESTTHKNWVRSLAEALVKNGVNVILDQWELGLGKDVLAFMERGVALADRVLLVFTPKYCQRANDRLGGVGYENVVITGELAGKLDTNKFIGLLREGSWDNAVPGFLKSRLHVDFTDDTNFDAAFEQLLRDIHNAPVYTKPIMGSNPFTQQPAPHSVAGSNTTASISPSAPQTEHSISGVHLDGQRRELLQAIVNGKKSFSPLADSDKAMQAFQVVAEILIELGKDEYLEDVRPHRELQTGKDYVDLVMVRGVTAKGRREAAMP